MMLFLKQAELAVSGNRKGRNFRKTEGSGPHNFFECVEAKSQRRSKQVSFFFVMKLEI